jgi:hypothetical protein
MNAHPHRLHGYVRPIPLKHMPKSGYVLVRNEPRDIREFDRAEQYCRNAPDLHETRHYRIGEETLLDLFAGIAFWFHVGIAPALCVLAIMVAK